MFTKIQTQLKSNKGFTLIELMVVISIIAILVAIALPRFAEARRSANTAKIAADLRSIDSAITMYEAANATAPPVSPTLIASVLWTGDTKYFASLPKPPKGPINYSTTMGGAPTPVDLPDVSYNLSTLESTVRGTVGVSGKVCSYEYFVGFNTVKAES